MNEQIINTSLGLLVLLCFLAGVFYVAYFQHLLSVFSSLEAKDKKKYLSRSLPNIFRIVLLFMLLALGTLFLLFVSHFWFEDSTSRVASARAIFQFLMAILILLGLSVFAGIWALVWLLGTQMYYDVLCSIEGIAQDDSKHGTADEKENEENKENLRVEKLKWLKPSYSGDLSWAFFLISFQLISFLIAIGTLIFTTVKYFK